MEMIEGRGIRPRTRFWRGPDLHDYHVNRVMNGRRISMRCVEWWMLKCPGRCSVSSAYTEFRQTTRHNHDPVKHRIQARAFRHVLMERCRSGDHTGYKRMYNQERRRLKISRQAASRMPLVTLRPSMRRARLENRPQIPRSIKELDKILSRRRYRKLSCTIDGKDNVYAGRAGSASQKTISALFVSRRMLRYMNKSRRVQSIFCDATFCPVPRGMKANQLFTISTIRQHHVIPLVRVLMRRRTTASYTAALEKIKKLAPGFQPKKIMSDFERAEQNALEMAFPNAQLHGCLFHYAKAIGCKARKLGMSRIIKSSRMVRRLIRWLSCLPLLPCDKIKKGFKIVCKEAVRKGVASGMLGILRYWARYWLPKVHILSVNAVIDMEDSTFQDIYILKKGRQANRIRSVSAVANDRTVTALTTDLAEGHISVREFLKTASFTILSALSRGLDGKRKKPKKRKH
ncbi:RuBisCO large subunit-binding protein subunit alpha, chloroplastic [Frankliniella fusca]|uniref:RuBisCO large subunit-binding protein subunit alpha, chloroplastic n=1 Tax=Frankliniella fusca TaxID=407009 RepID=A0AAE1H661_9NEOP|nr:RuBisCO large subunit-binding protein subunit alpha, chloroplastic [Frankliniella fusca]KAK3908315.1 RuBisCO large subunit-binding protein subunit alpha, chloroplastic [Frankliniella fusca]KAK3915293.1 RuBisCO large subunit-binding protein subunit alpha, chloroplastic [Frankliniella fusca]